MDQADWPRIYRLQKGGFILQFPSEESASRILSANIDSITAEDGNPQFVFLHKPGIPKVLYKEFRNKTLGPRPGASNAEQVIAQEHATSPKPTPVNNKRRVYTFIDIGRAIKAYSALMNDPSILSTPTPLPRETIKSIMEQIIGDTLGETLTEVTPVSLTGSLLLDLVDEDSATRLIHSDLKLKAIPWTRFRCSKPRERGPSDPLLCRQCWEYNSHPASRCKNQPRCRWCGELGHSDGVDMSNLQPACPRRGSIHSGTPSCLHCRGPHLPGTPNCRVWTDHKRTPKDPGSNPATTVRAPPPSRTNARSKPAQRGVDCVTHDQLVQELTHQKQTLDSVLAIVKSLGDRLISLSTQAYNPRELTRDLAQIGSIMSTLVGQQSLTESSNLEATSWANFEPTSRPFTWTPTTPTDSRPRYEPSQSEYPPLTPGKRLRSPPATNSSPTEPEPKSSRTGPKPPTNDQDDSMILSEDMTPSDAIAESEPPNDLSPDSPHSNQLTNADYRG